MGAVLTAFYMFRLIFLTFFGEERLDPHAKAHLHESPPVMTVPLVILAFFSVVAGYVGPARSSSARRPNLFRRFLEPVIHAGHEGASGHGHRMAPHPGLRRRRRSCGISIAYVFYLQIAADPRTGSSPGSRRSISSSTINIMSTRSTTPSSSSRCVEGSECGLSALRPEGHRRDDQRNGRGDRVLRQGAGLSPDRVDQGLRPGHPPGRRHLPGSVCCFDHELSDTEPRHVPPAGRGAVLLIFLPEGKGRPSTALALVVTLADVRRLARPLFPVRRRPWPSPSSSRERPGWATGSTTTSAIDGISLLLVLLTTFLMPIAVLSSWSVDPEEGQGIPHLHARSSRRGSSASSSPSTCSSSMSSGRRCSSRCTS